MRRPIALAGLLLGLLLAGGGALVLIRPPAPPPSARTAPSPPALIVSPEPFGSPSPLATPAPSHEGLRVKVPDLGIDLGIVEGDGWNAPLNLAARYPTLPWPGEGKRSMIYAHAQPGMFLPLWKAQVGERVDITRPSGAPASYVISEFYARWPATDLKWLQPRDQEELVLVTCTTYNPGDPRVIAVARPAH